MKIQRTNKITGKTALLVFENDRVDFDGDWQEKLTAAEHFGQIYDSAPDKYQKNLPLILKAMLAKWPGEYQEV